MFANCAIALGGGGGGILVGSFHFVRGMGALFSYFLSVSN